MSDPARLQAAEQRVVSEAVSRGWLTDAMVADARRAAAAAGQPLLVALRAHLGAEQQQVLGALYRDALALAPTFAAPNTAPPISPTTAVAAPIAGTRAAAPPSAWVTPDGEVPRQLGPYVLERELARGGMGSVHLARHVTLGRQVALKLMLGDGGDATRFEREARALAQLQHPNVVVLHESGIDAGRRWIALELVTGGSLQSRLDREGPLDPRVAVELMVPVARAMAAAHAAGLLHRDLKPANILIDEGGRPKITDFGLAKRLGAQTEQLTRAGEGMGTLGFAPPEQLLGEAVDARADVYGLGATLYYLLSARAPFHGTFLELACRVTREDPPPPSKHRPGLPRALDLVVLRCLERLPGDRYASAGALADDLQRWLADEPLEVQPPSVFKRLRRWRRRRPLLAAALSAALLTAVALAGVGLATRRPPPPPQAVVPTAVEWSTPLDGAETRTTTIELRGVVRGPAAWIDVVVVTGGADGARRRLRGAGDFTLPAPLKPGANDVLLRWTASSGESGELGPRRLSSVQLPDWFEALPAAERPPLPLPEGLTISDAVRLYTCTKDGSSLVWVPPGAFVMCKKNKALDPMSNAADGERPTTLTRGYFLGEREVTWGQFDAFMRDTKRPPGRPRQIAYKPADTAGLDFEAPFERLPAGKEFIPGLDHPRIFVSWEEAAAYCAWAGLRLPTDAEWEWAARGDDARLLPWGDEQPVSGDCNGLFPGDGFDYTAPVGTFPRDRTRSLCFDMAANVGEWVADWFAPIPAEPATDPKGPDSGTERVVRGAPWSHPAAAITLTRRVGEKPRDDKKSLVGFRVAR